MLLYIYCHTLILQCMTCEWHVQCVGASMIHGVISHACIAVMALNDVWLPLAGGHTITTQY